MEWRASLLSELRALRFRTRFYGRLAVLILHEVYNGVTHQPTLQRLLLLGTAYLLFVGYSAGIYSGEPLWVMAPSLLLSIIALMDED